MGGRREKSSIRILFLWHFLLRNWRVHYYYYWNRRGLLLKEAGFQRAKKSRKVHPLFFFIRGIRYLQGKIRHLGSLGFKFGVITLHYIVVVITFSGFLSIRVLSVLSVLRVSLPCHCNQCKNCANRKSHHYIRDIVPLERYTRICHANCPCKQDNSNWNRSVCNA